MNTSSTSFDKQGQPSLVVLFWINLTGVFMGGFLGAVVCAINSMVTTDYYRRVLNWRHVEEIHRAIIAQGIFEGLLFGLVFSLIFSFTAGIITRVRLPFLYGIKYLSLVIVYALICWLLGGVLGMLLAFLSPEFYQNTFRHTPDEFYSMLRFAWVGGSIWGLELGGFVSLLLSLVTLYFDWNQKMSNE